jgi:hypothetical protein
MNEKGRTRKISKERCVVVAGRLLETSITGEGRRDDYYKNILPEQGLEMTRELKRT